MAPALTPARQQYRQLVADVAARARAILPQNVNGRIEGAVKLVLAGDVAPQADGTVVVASCTDATKTYTLAGHTCTCTDFVQGKAPQGWCRHRIAAGISKRVQELVPASDATVAPQHHEAPASVNVRLTIGGREVQLTLRDTDEQRLLARLQAVLAQYPRPAQAPGKSQGSSQPQEGWCVMHDCAMKQTSKNGQTWFSHRLPDGHGWCKGRKGR
jgi:hypothetical protein